MSTSHLTRLALAGILGVGFSACGDQQQAKSQAAVKPEAAAKKTAKAVAKAPGKAQPQQVAANTQYKEVHGCAGLNVCKGLGGCKVSAEKLEKLAKKAGVPMEKALTSLEVADHGDGNA